MGLPSDGRHTGHEYLYAIEQTSQDRKVTLDAEF